VADLFDMGKGLLYLGNFGEVIDCFQATIIRAT